MRLCLNDSGIGGSYRDLKEERIKLVHDIGFRVAGIGADLNATDDDIKHVRDMFAKYGMSFGPTAGGSVFHVDPAVCKKNKDRLKQVIRIAGKVGCASIRISGGTMHPDNVWMHHPDNHKQKVFDAYVESTREIAPYAEDAGVMICPETTKFTILNGVTRMKEYVDRIGSPYVKVVFDFVNHMRYDRVYDSGRFVRRVVAELGDRIGVFHVKDVIVRDAQLITHIDESPLGTGVLDHEAVIEVSKRLEPWKTFSLEHFNEQGVPKEEQWRRGYAYIQGVADRMGHKWTDPGCTRERWEKGLCR